MEKKKTDNEVRNLSERIASAMALQLDNGKLDLQGNVEAVKGAFECVLCIFKTEGLSEEKVESILDEIKETFRKFDIASFGKTKIRLS